MAGFSQVMWSLYPGIILLPRNKPQIYLQHDYREPDGHPFINACFNWMFPIFIWKMLVGCLTISIHLRLVGFGVPGFHVYIRRFEYRGCNAWRRPKKMLQKDPWCIWCLGGFFLDADFFRRNRYKNRRLECWFSSGSIALVMCLEKEFLKHIVLLSESLRVAWWFPIWRWFCAYYFSKKMVEQQQKNPPTGTRPLFLRCRSTSWIVLFYRKSVPSPKLRVRTWK